MLSGPVIPQRRTITSRVSAMLSLGAVTLASVAVGADPNRPAARHPPKDDTYTITATIELVNPVDPAVMNDDFQDVRVLERDRDSMTLEVTYYPLCEPQIGENANWRVYDPGLETYLRPTTTENWDEKMQRDLLDELRSAGIDPDRLTDRQLVERVSQWAMRRAGWTQAFAIWAVHFPTSKPEVFPALRGAFDRAKPDKNWTDEQMFEQEVLGRSMFYQKVHGACTSTSVYLATIMRALGLPTRIIVCVPPFDPNDGRQAEMFYANVHHHKVRETVRAALDGTSGFIDHFFNEVYVNHRWERLNYSKLGQPIVDAKYFGLLTHIYTTADLSRMPLAETWGMRFFRYPAGQPRLSSSNPYRLLAVRDEFGSNARVENPPVPRPPELTTATIIALLLPDSPQLPKFVTDGWKPGMRRPDFLIRYKEWVPGGYRQMRIFQRHVGSEFILRSPGQPEVRARLREARWSQGNGSFQAYGAEVVPEDRDKVVPGAAYTITPINISETYRWELSAGLEPLVLKER